MSIKDLQKIGLTEKEARVYVACLEIGEGNVQEIAKKSGIKRTTTYGIISELKEKGLLSTTKRGEKYFYFAEDPRSLDEMLNERKETLKKILPELLSIANFIDKKPKIRYFEGDDGIREVYMDTLRYPGHEMLSWGSEKAVETFDADFLNDYYVPTRIKNRISVRAIAADNEIWQSYKTKDIHSLRKLRLVQKNKYPFSVEIDLYGNRRVAILAFEEKIALIVESEKIYNTLKNIFEMSWDTLSD